MKFAIIVVSRQGKHHFCATLHTATSSEAFHLHPEEFYLKHGRVVPPVPHSEIEITVPILDELKKHKAHIQLSRKNGRPFMCYPRHIPGTVEAFSLFRTWCLGTVLKMVEGLDLNTVLDGECGGDVGKFTSLLFDRFHIETIDEQLI